MIPSTALHFTQSNASSVCAETPAQGASAQAEKQRPAKHGHSAPQPSERPPPLLPTPAPTLTSLLRAAGRSDERAHWPAGPEGPAPPRCRPSSPRAPPRPAPTRHWRSWRLRQCCAPSGRGGERTRQLRAEVRLNRFPGPLV